MLLLSKHTNYVLCWEDAFLETAHKYYQFSYLNLKIQITIMSVWTMRDVIIKSNLLLHLSSNITYKQSNNISSMNYQTYFNIDASYNKTVALLYHKQPLTSHKKMIRLYKKWNNSKVTYLGDKWFKDYYYS